MNMEEMKTFINQLMKDNHKAFAQALISIEKGIDNSIALDVLYDEYMENDGINLLNDEFDTMIEHLELESETEVRQVFEDKKGLVNLVGNLTKDIEVKQIVGKDGNSFKVANFSIVKNEGEAKIYTNISAYGDKAEQVSNYKKGDFISVFGKEKVSIGQDEKEYKNVQLYSSKLLKAKTVDKSSTIDSIKNFQNEIKNTPKEVAKKTFEVDKGR